MRLFPALALPALAVVALLAGCTSAPPVDEEALSAWQHAHERSGAGDDALATLYSRVNTGEGQTDASGELQRGITITFEHPEQIDHLEFSCFGDARMTGGVMTTSESTSRTTSTDPMSCSDGQQRVDLPRTWRRDVDSISFNAFDSDRDSAWQVLVVSAGTDTD
ncbi:hypothetical protein [Curtobacterium sp. VKM Ac-1393]|uniref:hypothetical protein n=1 Tax=Curtobacterium sp. VKM Ac-1393 TaxID=2783814 RepID=UPI00188CE671|nr:hypothetical protein [Curtobacterium sp. VKM Ac-1393]MBF4609492.1 hypothetical protein [Curtobacterium sp. VKM Ac-1393]